MFIVPCRISISSSLRASHECTLILVCFLTARIKLWILIWVSWVTHLVPSCAPCCNIALFDHLFLRWDELLLRLQSRLCLAGRIGSWVGRLGRVADCEHAFWALALRQTLHHGVTLLVTEYFTHDLGLVVVVDWHRRTWDLPLAATDLGLLQLLTEGRLLGPWVPWDAGRSSIRCSGFLLSVAFRHAQVLYLLMGGRPASRSLVRQGLVDVPARWHRGLLAEPCEEWRLVCLPCVGQPCLVTALSLRLPVRCTGLLVGHSRGLEVSSAPHRALLHLCRETRVEAVPFTLAHCQHLTVVEAYRPVQAGVLHVLLGLQSYIRASVPVLRPDWIPYVVRELLPIIRRC